MRINRHIRLLEQALTERRMLIGVMVGLGVFFSAMLLFSTGFSHPDETLARYALSRWGLRHPEQLLELRNGPLFMLLSAPFAHLGLKSFLLFNVMLGMASGYMSYLMARELRLKAPIVAVAICCFSPIYMASMFSGLMELLMGLVAIVAAWLYLRQRTVPAAMVASLLPLIRVDGYLLLLGFALYHLARGRYRQLPLLLLGLGVFCTVGLLSGLPFAPPWAELGFVHDGLHGTARLWQFAKRSPGYFGIANEIFFVTGLVAALVALRRKKGHPDEVLLVVLPFVLYFVGHSVAGSTGLCGSGAHTRYMAAAVPLMAVMATRGLVLFSLMFQILTKSQWVRRVAFAFAFVSVIIIPLYNDNYPLEEGVVNDMHRRAATLALAHVPTAGRMFYTDPTMYYYLGINPFDTVAGRCGLRHPQQPELEMSIGDMLLVDHHSELRWGLGLNDALANPHLLLVGLVEPAEPINVLGHRDAVGVFRRTSPTPANAAYNQQQLQALSQGFTPLVERSFDTDEGLAPHNIDLIGIERSSPNRYLRIDRRTQFALTDTLPLPDTAVGTIVVQVEMKLSRWEPDEDLRLVVERLHHGRRLGRSRIIELAEPIMPQRNEWIQAQYRLRAELDEGQQLVVRLWNKRKRGFMVDDYSISVRADGSN